VVLGAHNGNPEVIPADPIRAITSGWADHPGATMEEWGFLRGCQKAQYNPPPLRQKIQVVDNADFLSGDFPCYFFRLNFTVLFTEAKL
jgi:hypothetical protein